MTRKQRNHERRVLSLSTNSQTPSRTERNVNGGYDYSAEDREFSGIRAEYASSSKPFDVVAYGQAREAEVEHTSAFHRASVPCNSVPAPLRHPQSRQGSQVPADDSLDSSLDSSHSLNLDAIPEDPEIGQPNDDSSSMRPRDGLGRKLGSSSLHSSGFSFLSLPYSTLAALVFHHHGDYRVGSMDVPGTACWTDTAVSLPSLPSWSSSLHYTLPGIPAENIEQLNARLKVIEYALSALILENEQTRVKTANGIRPGLGWLDGWAVGCWVRCRRRCLLSRPVPTVEADVEHSGNDEEARAKLAALEERFGSVKEASRKLST
ncbi:hypothetical protein BDP27DRAFT_1429096 [Rhodocollybia butyracea]|uniref:Uncharacterized protein n=1 Tax=Rhodocollybia butyracea TaxID=206335 RepID=A0A9P5U000_9AGAR|nr:hypothetical protein BDP27DRAFT_1429096 [Rhodocollybia butyracea]